MDLMEKLNILADAAKYDAACTSSGVTRGGIWAMGAKMAPLVLSGHRRFRDCSEGSSMLTLKRSANSPS